jgi:DeoR/GlpR family transcriptional regulator of sugar metabolism
VEETHPRKAARPSPEPGRRRLLPAMRQAAMLSLLAERGVVSAADLTALLGVSLMTVHRDLNALERRGLVLKTFGGAIATSYHQAAYFRFAEQVQLRQAQKIAIAERAVTLVLPGDTIVIDGSTTGYWFAKRLTRAVANWAGRPSSPSSPTRCRC